MLESQATSPESQSGALACGGKAGQQVPSPTIFSHFTCPEGSKYPIFKDSGLKNHTLNGIWDQSP